MTMTSEEKLIEDLVAMYIARSKSYGVKYDEKKLRRDVRISVEKLAADISAAEERALRFKRRRPSQTTDLGEDDYGDEKDLHEDNHLE